MSKNNHKWDIEDHCNKKISDFSQNDIRKYLGYAKKMAMDELDYQMFGYDFTFERMVAVLLKTDIRSIYHARAKWFDKKRDVVYKYIQPKYIKSTLENNELFFQNPVNWSDTTDCNMQTLRGDKRILGAEEQLREKIPESPLKDELIKYYFQYHDNLIDILDKFRNNALVCCFSEIEPTCSRSIPLWKKFASSDSNTVYMDRKMDGICLEINTNCIPCRVYKVKYEMNEPKDILGIHVANHMFNYDKEDPMKSRYLIAAEMMTSVFRKYPTPDNNYSEEAEWRCIWMEDGKCGCKKLKAGAIKRIFVGKDISDIDLKYVNRYAKNCGTVIINSKN